MVGDHRVFSSHDTSQTNGLFSITDHQYRIVQSSLLAVQSHKFFVFLGTADNNLMTGNGVHIIGMHRLSELFHHIVGNIYQVIDRTDTVSSQTSLHPFGRRTDLYIFYHSCTISWAQIRILYSYFHVVMSVFAVSLYLYYRRNKLLVKSSRRLSGNADDAVAVYTVGRNLIFKNHIIQSQSVDGAFPYYCVFRENINSVFRSFRIKLSGGTQLFNGAHHSVGVYPSELACLNRNAPGSLLSVVASCNSSSFQNYRNLISFFYIWRSCNDLDRLCSDIYLADDQFICIRVFFNFLDLSDNDLIQVSIQFLIAFHLGS